MNLFLSVAILLGLAALFGFINERFLRLQATIGLMLLALSMELALKTWYAFDYDTAEAKRSHDLLKCTLRCFLKARTSSGTRSRPPWPRIIQVLNSRTTELKTSFASLPVHSSTGAICTK